MIEQNSRAIQEDYSDFLLRFPWDIYSTITYRIPRYDGPYWAKRAFAMLEKFDASRAFVAIEPHRLEGLHLHVLSRHLPSPERLDSLWKYSFKAFGRSQMEWVEDTCAVSRYCAKYVVKGNNYEFFGDASAWRYDDDYIPVSS